MSILKIEGQSIYYSIIFDWISSPRTKFTRDVYELHQRRLYRHAQDLTKHLLKMFFTITIIIDFVIIDRTRFSITERGDSYEEMLDIDKERYESECYYEELINTEYTTHHEVYAIEAILEDNCICKHPKAWIGHVFKELWPFLSGAPVSVIGVSPGIYPWKNGKRIIPKIDMIPIISRRLFEDDDLYS